MKQQDRFENHMDVSSPETIGDAKETSEFDNSDTSEFDTKLDNYYKLQKLSDVATALGSIVSTFTDGRGEIQQNKIYDATFRPDNSKIVIERQEPTFSNVNDFLDNLGYTYEDDKRGTTEKSIIAAGSVIENIGADESYALEPLEDDFSDAANDESINDNSPMAGSSGDIPKHMTTSIDDKVSELPQQELPDSICVSFQNSEYRTVRASDDMVLYRVFGGNAPKEGRYLTTEIPSDRMDTKMNSALLPEWKNSRQYYCEVYVPAGTVLNIGKVAAQETMEGHTLGGGADQIYVSAEFADNSKNYGETRPLGFGGNRYSK